MVWMWKSEWVNFGGELEDSRLVMYLDPLYNNVKASADLGCEYARVLCDQTFREKHCRTLVL